MQIGRHLGGIGGIGLANCFNQHARSIVGIAGIGVGDVTVTALEFLIKRFPVRTFVLGNLGFIGIDIAVVFVGQLQVGGAFIEDDVGFDPQTFDRIDKIFYLRDIASKNDEIGLLVHLGCQHGIEIRGLGADAQALRNVRRALGDFAGDGFRQGLAIAGIVADDDDVFPMHGIDSSLCKRSG